MPWSCCAGLREAPPPKRAKIDRAMIGAPTNFQHTSHIGSALDDAVPIGGPGIGARDTHRTHMESKGGHVAPDDAIPVDMSVASRATPIVHKTTPEHI